jgi:heat shock protein HslJ
VQKRLRIPVFLWLALLASCSADSIGATTEVIYHVNSFRVPCTGVAPMSCLQVKRGDPADGEWQNFYAQIEGFEYQPGNLYRLLVRQTNLPPEAVPADASSIRYELVEILEQVPDPRLEIHDIWVVERIEGADRDNSDPASMTAQPYIEFNIPRGEYLGNDGCNAIRGEVQVLTPQELRLGQATSTDAVGSCDDGLLQSKLLRALDGVAYWRRDGLRLALLDADEVVLIVLRKTD